MTTTLRDVRSTGWTTTEARDAVVLFLHGFGSNEQDLSGLAPALGLDLPWASLRAPLELGNGGAAWFEITTPASRMRHRSRRQPPPSGPGSSKTSTRPPASFPSASPRAGSWPASCCAPAPSASSPR